MLITQWLHPNVEQCIYKQRSCYDVPLKRKEFNHRPERKEVLQNNNTTRVTPLNCSDIGQHMTLQLGAPISWIGYVLWCSNNGQNVRGFIWKITNNPDHHFCLGDIFSGLLVFSETLKWLWPNSSSVRALGFLISEWVGAHSHKLGYRLHVIPSKTKCLHFWNSEASLVFSNEWLLISIWLRND